MDTLLHLFKALSDSTRLRLFRILARYELTVTELTQGLVQSQPRISRHLKLLCQGGLVYRFQEGSWVFYRLARTPLAQKMAGIVLDPAHVLTLEMEEDDTRVKGIVQARAEKASLYFSTHAHQWESLRESYIHQQDIDSILESILLPLSKTLVPKEKTLVDLGTGTGYIVRKFSPLFQHVIGIDNSPEMLQIARVQMMDRGFSHVQIRRGDLENIPLNGQLAEVAILHMVLCYTENPGMILKESARILKAEGTLILVDFAPHEQEYLREHHAHRRLGLETSDLKEWLEEGGLTLKEVRDIRSPSKASLALEELPPPVVRLWTAQK